MSLICGKPTKTTGKPCQRGKNCHLHIDNIETKKTLKVTDVDNNRVSQQLELSNNTYQQVFDMIDDKFKVAVFAPKLEKLSNMNQEGDFDKFGGIPSIEPDFKYPHCKDCNSPMQFFFQLTPPSDLKPHPNPGATLQVFNCVSCDESYSIRWIKYGGVFQVKNFITAYPALLENITKHAYGNEQKGASWVKTTHPYECYRLVEWKRHMEFGIQDDIVEQVLTDLKIKWNSDTVNDFWSWNRVQGLKFGGMGESTQGIDYSDHFLHFDNQCYLPFMWGDSGYAHIEQKSPDEMNLNYDCC